jgi:hypothetical protein
VHLVEHVGDEVIPHSRDRHDLERLDPYTKHTYSPSITRESKDKNRAHQARHMYTMSQKRERHKHGWMHTKDKDGSFHASMLLSFARPAPPVNKDLGGGSHGVGVPLRNLLPRRLHIHFSYCYPLPGNNLYSFSDMLLRQALVLDG